MNLKIFLENEIVRIGWILDIVRQIQDPGIIRED